VLRCCLNRFDVSYAIALDLCDVRPLVCRRGAAGVVSLVKYSLSAHYVLSGFVCYGSDLRTRRGGRGDTARDFVLVRNYFGDTFPTPFTTHSASFKKSFFYRSAYNYNVLRRLIDLDSYSFSDLRRVLSLFAFDDSGFVVP
jgi:hypothetical protein